MTNIPLSSVIPELSLRRMYSHMCGLTKNNYSQCSQLDSSTFNKLLRKGECMSPLKITIQCSQLDSSTFNKLLRKGECISQNSTAYTPYLTRQMFQSKHNLPAREGLYSHVQESPAVEYSRAFSMAPSVYMAGLYSCSITPFVMTTQLVTQLIGVVIHPVQTHPPF